MTPVKRAQSPIAYSGPAAPDRRLTSMFAPRSASARAGAVSVCMLSGHTPNRSALPEFVDELRTWMLAGQPDMVLDIVGAGPTADGSEQPNGTAATAGRSVARVMNKHGVAIIHYPDVAYGGDQGDQVLDVLQWINVPVIVVMHSVHMHPSAQERFIVEMLTSSADAVVTMSEAGRRVLLDDYRVEPRRLMMIRHGATVPAPQMPSERAEPKRRPAVLIWGQLGPGTDVELGLTALSRVRGLRPSPQCVVAGPLDPSLTAARAAFYHHALTRTAEDLHLDARLTLEVGELTADRVDELLNAADVIVLPHAATDPTAAVVLARSIAAGKPIVSTPFPHAQEMLADGRGGLLTPHGDASAMAAAMHRVLTEPALAETMTAANTTLAPSLAWPLVASQYSQLIHALLGRPRA